MKKICVLTGTRAEYGLLKPLISKISADQELELQLLVTGMHLSPEFGLTYQEIEKDGYTISWKTEMLLSSDTTNAVTKSMGIGIIGFADAFSYLNPDIVIILGDRYEAFSAAVTAMIYRVPIVHLHGGEITEGAMDESIRHAITKMSYLHFTSTEEHRRRVIQLGEFPDRVYNVGALGVENIHTLTLLNETELEQSLHFRVDKKTVIVTYHPVTLEKETSKEQFNQLLKALEKNTQLKLIFTKANSDTDGRIINRMIDNFAAQNRGRSIVFDSLGQLRYLSALKYCGAVIGNSSSGIIEAPSFHIPTINIGDRQKGRTRAESVINCICEQKEIEEAIAIAFSEKFLKKIKEIKNPYEGNHTSEAIINILKEYLKKGINIKKGFYDITQGMNLLKGNEYYV